MIKLKNILLEDSRKVRKGAEDLYAWMKNPLSAQGADPTAKLSGSAKFLVSKGEEDGDSSDDSTITPGGLQDISVDKIQASQNEVGKEQSLANVMTGVDGMAFDGIDYGDVNWLIDAMKPGAKITFKDALLGAKTEDGMVVLDGHHRWSQAFMINPTAQVNVEVAKSNLSADDTLQAVHLAILAKTGASKTKGAKGGNLFAANESDVAGYLNAPKRKVDPKTGEDSDTGIAPYIYAVMKTKNITDPVEGKKAAIAYAMEAIKKCAATVVPGAPSRDSMPQADGKLNAIDAKGAFASLGSGEVNFSPPYRKESIQNKKSILTKNTMKQKLKISIAEQKETLKMKRTARIISEAEYQKQIRLIEAEYKVQTTDQTSFPKNEDEARDLATQAASGDETAPLFKAMEQTKKGKDGGQPVVIKADPVKVKAWVEKIGGIDELVKRILVIANKIPETGLEKKDMPFLPGPDDAVGTVDDVEDALNPGGTYNADVVGSKIATPAPKKVGGSSGKPDEAGMTYMKSGFEDGDETDDDVEFKKAPEIAASAAIPTQTNILFPKSLGMAVGGVSGGDLGAYFSKKGEILDGHHRWAATMLNDPNAKMSGFAYIDLEKMGGKENALKKLTAIGNALGNKTKTESKNRILTNLETILQESIATWKKHRRK